MITTKQVVLKLINGTGDLYLDAIEAFKLRQYVYHLETRCDPSGDVQTIASLTEQRDALLKAVDLATSADKYLREKHLSQVEWGIRIRRAEKYGGNFSIELSLYMKNFPDDFKEAAEKCEYLKLAKLLHKYRKNVKGCFYHENS